MTDIVKFQEAYFAAVLHRLLSYRHRHELLSEAAIPGRLSPEPLILHDLTGSPVFYLFLEKSEDERITGSSWVSVTPTSARLIVAETWGGLAWDPDEARHKAENLAQELKQPGDAIELRFVCYSYPKIAVLVQIKDRSGTIRTQRMFDVIFWTEIILEAKTKLGTPSGTMDSSFLKTYRGPAPESKRLEKEQNWYLGFLPETNKGALKISEIEAIATASAGKIRLESGKANILKEVSFFQQQEDYWCVPACAQMILPCYNVKNKEQAAIAAAMQSGAGGTTLDNEVGGYQTILGEDHEILKCEPNWDIVTHEIDGGVPLRIRINDDKHAVVCLGYEMRNRPDGSGRHDLILIVNDPYQGKHISLSWDDISQDNYLYIH